MYPIPGNDDTTGTVLFYYQLFKRVVTKRRREELKMLYVGRVDLFVTFVVCKQISLCVSCMNVNEINKQTKYT